VRPPDASREGGRTWKGVIVGQERAGHRGFPSPARSCITKAAGQLRITFSECAACHAVVASVSDRGVWDRIDFSVEYQWKPVLAGPQTTYTYPGTIIISQHAGATIFRWVALDGQERHELHLGETDELCRYLRRLARPSNRSRLRRLLDAYITQGQRVGLQWLGAPAFRLGDVLMSAVHPRRDPGGACDQAAPLARPAPA
jgi:hypothetical protein